MHKLGDDIIEVCDAVDILEGRKRSPRPTKEVARDAIAAWERVDSTLHEHFAQAVADETGITLKRPRAKR